MIIKSIYNTFPSIIHSPDWETNKYWSNLVRVACKQNNNKTEISKELTIVTWNNLKEGVFEKSLNSKNIPFIVKGSKDKIWSNYKKFEYNIEIAKECKTKYLMGCDSHDVIMIQNNMINLIKKFKKLNCKLLFNCEKFFYPNIAEKIMQNCKTFEKKIGKGKYNFLNAGAWIGETDFCLKFFQRANQIRVYNLFNCEPYKNLKKTSIGCDQSSLHYVFKEFYPKVKLDYKCELFLNISFPQKNEIIPEFKLL